MHGFQRKNLLLVGGSLYFSVVFAVLEHSVLEREYAPLFQDDFVLLLLREGGGRSLFVLQIEIPRSFNYAIHSFAYNKKVYYWD